LPLESAAAHLGHRLLKSPIDTADPALRLDVDGRYLAPASATKLLVRFELGPRAAFVRILSRTCVPARDLGGGATDTRRLGVPIRRIELRGAMLELSLPHDDPSLVEGFHPPEAAHRWTDGAAVLPGSWLLGLQEGFTLDLHLAPSSLRYVTGE
jgi:hypothetical protein